MKLLRSNEKPAIRSKDRRNKNWELLCALPSAARPGEGERKEGEGRALPATRGPVFSANRALRSHREEAVKKGRV